MEQPDTYASTPQSVSDLTKDARDICERALTRITASAKKYGEAYVLADISKEFEAEVDDLPGWVLLQAVRINRIAQGTLNKLDGEYLEKFLKYHDTNYLSQLKDAIGAELSLRNGKE